jgi:hypothetical protein
MTEDEREELIVKMAKAAYESHRAMRWCNERERGWWLQEARAALAVAEPVIREECARVADEHSAEVNVSKFSTATNALCAQKMAKDIAAAIREGKND